MSFGLSRAVAAARELRVPRPLPAAAPLLAAAAAAIALAAIGVLPGAVCLVVVSGFVLLAALRASLAARDRWVLRRTADRVLGSGVEAHPQCALLVWRATELTSVGNRRMLARSLGRIARELEQSTPMSSVRLNRRGARPHVELVRALAARLTELERRVSAQGMVLVEELVTDGYRSPLYAGAHAGDVRLAIRRCFVALDGGQGAERSRVAAELAPGLRIHSGRRR